MDQQTAEALQAFTQRYCEAWQQQRSSLPRSEELYGIPSPCVNGTDDDGVFWQPQPFSLEQNIHAVERALEIVVQQPLHAYYTTQFAGDMQARFADETMTLLQTWSPDDFQRVQENLIQGGVPLKPQKDGVRRRSLLALRQGLEAANASL